jgi:hypothetical protein
MLIAEKALRHWIDHFFGFGSWKAGIWFVAFEEGGGDQPEEVAEKLNYFHSAHSSAAQPRLCDIREMYRHSAFRLEGPKAAQFENQLEYRFGRNAVLSGVWKNLISFSHGYSGQRLQDILTYQKKQLALPSAAKEALIRLYPLPSPNHHAWYYSWLDMPKLGFLKSRKLYQEHLYPTRIKAILQAMSEYKPEVMLMYGMENINVLKKSVQDFYPGTKFKTVKAVKLHTPQYHRADISGTTLLITTQIPALRHGRIETGFDWMEFGRSVKNSTQARN